MRHQCRADRVDCKGAHEASGVEVAQAFLRASARVVKHPSRDDDEIERRVDTCGSGGDRGWVGQIEVGAGEGGDVAARRK